MGQNIYRYVISGGIRKKLRILFHLILVTSLIIGERLVTNLLEIIKIQNINLSGMMRYGKVLFSG